MVYIAYVVYMQHLVTVQPELCNFLFKTGLCDLYYDEDIIPFSPPQPHLNKAQLVIIEKNGIKMHLLCRKCMGLQAGTAFSLILQHLVSFPRLA